jgi:hypothetical protein
MSIIGKILKLCGERKGGKAGGNVVVFGEIWGEEGRNIMITDWIQAICSILGIILAFIAIKVSIPKISKKMDDISKKMSHRRFNACKNCGFENACVSPYLEDIGDFDKKNEIEDQEIANAIIKLFEEIKRYKFEEQEFVGSREHQECLLRKLTMSMNLIGSANMGFNKAKDKMGKQ